MTTPTYSTTGKVGKSILLFSPMCLLIFILITQFKLHFDTVADTIAFSVTFLFLCYLFFMMLYSGKTDLYRAIGFIVFALFFSFTFIVNLYEIRGSNAYNQETILSCSVPMCHIPSTMFIIPAALTKTIIFPTNIFSIAFMFVMIIGVGLAIGRAFCSWGCFYGGWDEGASRIVRKPVIKKVNSAFRWTSFAVFIVIALWSAATLSPTYCWWLCPFKAVTEYEQISSFTAVLKTIVFVLIFVGMVIILPVLTKKRMFCATFCPMGAFLSLTNKVNIFDVRIDKERCSECMVCTKTCPTLSMDKADIENAHPSITCTKCGKCIDTCSKKAIHYHIKGTPVNSNLSIARYLFLYPSFLILVVISGGTIKHGIVLLINLVTTGSMY
jgi:polyferredoxin